MGICASTAFHKFIQVQLRLLTPLNKQNQQKVGEIEYALSLLGKQYQNNSERTMRSLRLQPLWKAIIRIYGIVIRAAH